MVLSSQCQTFCRTTASNSLKSRSMWRVWVLDAVDRARASYKNGMYFIFFALLYPDSSTRYLLPVVVLSWSFNPSFRICVPFLLSMPFHKFYLFIYLAARSHGRYLGPGIMI